MEPIISFPSRDYDEPVKFVQLDVTNGSEVRKYLFFGSEPKVSDSYYRKILINSLSGLNLEYRWDRLASGTPVPQRCGERYFVRGMGMAIVSRKNHSFKVIDGVFGDYNLGIDKSHLEKIVDSLGKYWKIEAL